MPNCNWGKQTTAKMNLLFYERKSLDIARPLGESNLIRIKYWRKLQTTSRRNDYPGMQGTRGLIILTRQISPRPNA